MNHRFTKKEHLRKKKEFQIVFDKGNGFGNDQIIIYALLNKSPVSRLGLVVGRKFGNSVKRNRFKRIIREAYRLNKNLLGKGVDLVVIPKAGLADISLSLVEDKFKNLLIQINEQLKNEIHTY